MPQEKKGEILFPLGANLMNQKKSLFHSYIPLKTWTITNIDIISAHNCLSFKYLCNLQIYDVNVKSFTSNAKLAATHMFQLF